MLFEDMNWMDVERYLERDDRVMVITGACEQHGYLSLLTDIRIPLTIAREACKKEGVLIAPPLAYGISPYFVTYPGTLSLRPETFATIVRDLLEGLLKQGFRRILVNNGHGGNIGLLTALLVELGTAHADARFALFNWWTEAAVTAVAQEAGLPPNHANWTENFDFTRVGPVPQGEKEEPVGFSPTASAAVTRAALGDGSFGGPYQAADEVMERILAVAAEALAAALQRL